jgi:hypothetical protein
LEIEVSRRRGGLEASPREGLALEQKNTRSGHLVREDVGRVEQVDDVRLAPQLARERAAQRKLLPKAAPEHPNVDVAVSASATPSHRSKENHQAQAGDGARLLAGNGAQGLDR